MDKISLIESATKLKPVSSTSIGEYQQRAEKITGVMNERMLQRSDLETLIGSENIEMMKDNHANHVRFIASILKNYNPEVFVDTVLWVFRAYRSHGFTANYWASQLNTWIEILKEVLMPESFEEVYPYYEWMQVNIPVFVKLTDEAIEASNSGH